MGFDIPLMTHRYRIGLLNNDIGGLKRRIGIAHGEADMRCEVCRLLGISVGEAIVMQNGRIRRQCRVCISHRWQNLISDLNRLCRLGSQRWRCRCNCRYGLRVKQHLALRHHHWHHVLERHGTLAATQHFVPRFHQIIAGHHREHTLHGERLAAIDRLNHRVGVGASYYVPIQLPLHIKIRAVARPPGDLVEPIGPNRSRTNNFEFLIGVHAASSRIVLAASNTARIILS